MSRLRTVWLGLAVWLLLAGVALGGNDFALTVLHTNDIHAHLAPFDRFGAMCDEARDKAGECLGGAARLATAVARERTTGGDLLLLDAGDQFQGTLFFNRYKGQACAFFMNRLRYDAMTLGNHEFDDGQATLAAFIKAVRFPVLAANVDFAGAPALRGLTAPFIMREFHGRKVGIVGVTQPGTPEMSSPGPGLSFEAVAPAVARAVAALRQQGVDICIVVSHAGLKGDMRLAASVPGIDVIVGGHSHVLLGNGYPEAVGPCPLAVDAPDGGRTYIVTAGSWGRYLGVLHVAFDEAGRVTRAEGNPVFLDASLPEDPATAAEVERYVRPLEALRKVVLGRTATPIGAATCRQEECAAGDVLAEAMLAAGRRYGAVAALANGGNVRAGFAPGPVTLGDVLTAYPFSNTLAVVTLSGADLRAALEHGLTALNFHAGSGRFPQVAGLRYAYDPNRPAGRRLVSVAVADAKGAFTPLDPAASYRVAVSDFLLRGGDGFTIFGAKGGESMRDGPPLADVVAEYLKVKGELRVDLDGRIRADTGK